jgi:radical SAM protein with 4Fe4S-binding SPASM domain
MNFLQCVAGVQIGSLRTLILPKHKINNLVYQPLLNVATINEDEGFMNQEKIHTQDNYGVREEASEFPMMVVLSFIYVCNTKCPNCPYNNSDIRETYKDAMIMPDDIFKQIADECGEYHSLLRLSGGGEPMLHPRAVDLMLYAKKKGCKVGLITNGSNFSKDSLTALMEANIDAIEFSIDAGDPETYSVVRPGLDWDNLCQNVNMAVEIRNKHKYETKIICSIINQEGVDVDAAEEYWSKIVDKVQVRKYLTWGYNDDNSADSAPYLPPEERLPCPWLFERLNVDSRGDVTLCGEDIAFDEKFANIKDKSIKEIWNGSEFKLFRDKHINRLGRDIEICAQCPDWQFRSWKYNYWKVLKDADEKMIK